MRTLLRIATAAALLVACSETQPPDEPVWTRLPNGLRVAVRPIPGAKTVAVLATFAVGSDHDPEGQSGLAHLAEHLFVVSAAGATKARTVREWTESNPGGLAYAVTLRRSTIYQTVVAPAALEAELTDLASRMSELHITQADLDQERARVLDQIADAGRMEPRGVSIELALERVCPPPHGGHPVGVRAEVEKLTLDDVQDWCRRWYRPVNARLVLVGDVEPAAATTTLVALHWDDRTGSVVRQIGDQKFPKDEDLERAIAAAHKEWVRKGEPHAAVTIDADSRVPWKDVIVVMNLAKHAGIDKIEFAFSEPDRK